MGRWAPIGVFAALFAGCGSSTSVTLDFQFDCSIDPARIQRLEAYFEPSDGAAFQEIQPVTRFEDDVLVRTHDIDGDGELEVVLTLYASRFVMKDGLRVRMAVDSPPPELRMRVIAGDAQDRQIGQGPDREGSFLTVDFLRDREVDVEVPVTCLCLGLAACGGACEEQPTECGPGEPLPLDGRHERLCGDGLGGFDDDLSDCADRECWTVPACAECTTEVCSNRIDDDCDGALDCGDADCARAPGCENCTVEDCGQQDDDDPEHDDDEDCDGSVDCADPDCADTTRCRTCPNPVPEICGDTQDNDCDGRTDCRDADECLPAAERCDNGFDDDCDGFADCADEACADLCCQRGIGRTEDCSNGIDDDCDHLVDCADLPVCGHAAENGPGVCHDFADNDCDGATDCVDPECEELAVPEVCGNGVDDDCDGLIDCADATACPPTGPELDCGNGVDDDCDGFTDCFDTDCSAPEADFCGDRRDNDCDGLWDCSDPDCVDKPECLGCRPEVCSNGRDDDCDGWRDCADQDCAPFCAR